jgi:hypothetical protein
MNGPNADLDGLLAQIFETLKRHENALFDLRVDAESAKHVLTGQEVELFEQAREKALRVSAEARNLQARAYDVIIERLRRKA